jgi:imidazolonepropionase-like amidohydrolase
MKQVVTLLAVALSVLTPAAPGQTVAFENVNVIPMDRERVIEGQTVIVSDGKIAQIGPAASVKAPAGATRIDSSGKYLMPGLAEMHGHLTAQYLPPEAAQDLLFLYLANGVTTVRAMLGNPEAIKTRDAVASGEILGPKLYVAGPPFNSRTVPTVEAAGKEVREQKAMGYDLLKILGGMEPEVYETVARTAHELKIDFAGHVPPQVGVRGALKAGQRSIDHLDNYIASLELTPSTPRQEEDRRIAELVKLTVEAGVWNVPTMYLWDVSFHNAETGEALRQRLTEVRYMPKSMVEEWVNSKDRRLLPPNDTPAGIGAFGQTGVRVMELRRKILKALKAANALIALGTDSPQTFSVPGFSIHRELNLMVEEGFTPFEAIETGTVNVARYFGTTAETGIVATGKRADLILLNGNPLQDISHTEKPAGVMLNGRWLPESEIQQRLEKIAAKAATM